MDERLGLRKEKHKEYVCVDSGRSLGGPSETCGESEIKEQSIHPTTCVGFREETTNNTFNGRSRGGPSVAYERAMDQSINRWINQSINQSTQRWSWAFLRQNLISTSNGRPLGGPSVESRVGSNQSNISNISHQSIVQLIRPRPPRTRRARWGFARRKKEHNMYRSVAGWRAVGIVSRAGAINPFINQAVHPSIRPRHLLHHHDFSSTTRVAASSSEIEATDLGVPCFLLQYGEGGTG